MSRTHKHLAGGPARSRVSWLALGLVAAVAGCLGGNSTKEIPGTGGQAPGREPPPAETMLSCAVQGETALGTTEGSSPVIAFGAGRYAVAWTEQATGLHVSIFDAKGNQAATSVIPGNHPTQVAVTALEGGRFLVVWQEAGVVRGARLGADGVRACAPFTIATTAGGEARPSTAAAAAGTAVAWADASGVIAGGLDGDHLGSTVTVAGAADPSLTASAGALGLTFITGTKVGFARLALPARGIDPVLFRDASGKANVPRASAARDGGFYVVWEDARGGDGNEAVYATLVDKAGKPAGEEVVSGEGSADYPDVATFADHAAVVYYSFRDGPPVVYLTLLDAALHRGCDDLRISGKGARFPRVAAGDGELGVVYAQTGAPARFARVTCH